MIYIKIKKHSWRLWKGNYGASGGVWEWGQVKKN